jgi:UV DNA damage endonuclease
MKIGYPCINRSIGCQGNKKFRLKSYSEEKFISTVKNNLDCLLKMLQFNLRHHLFFFRITSDLVPFASHPVCQFLWQPFFSEKFKTIGRFIKDHHFRISMHPDQFTLINTPDINIFNRSVAELFYHADVLNLLELDENAKIQIHVGGVYGDKVKSMNRFIERFYLLDKSIQERLIIENDDRHYTLNDCMFIHEEIGIPVLYDVFHFSLLNKGEALRDALTVAASTWHAQHGLPMVDYSSQKPNARRGTHAESIDVNDFSNFMASTGSIDFDVMLEIKDKETSALKARDILKNDIRFYN